MSKTIVRRMDFGCSVRTEVWISDKAAKIFAKYQRKKENPKGQLLKKLKECAEKGFALFEGDDRPIRPEKYDTIRIGPRTSTFRLYGFYPKDRESSKDEFIIIEADDAHAYEEGRSSDKKCREVQRVKEDDDWEKAL